jgi:hypothetical protein
MSSLKKQTEQSKKRGAEPCNAEVHCGKILIWSVELFLRMNVCHNVNHNRMLNDRVIEKNWSGQKK